MPNKELTLQIFRINKLQHSKWALAGKRFTLVEEEQQDGDEYYENLDEAKVDRILEELK